MDAILCTFMCMQVNAELSVVQRLELKREVVLRCLPIYFNEPAENFFRDFEVRILLISNPVSSYTLSHRECGQFRPCLHEKF